MMKIKDVEKLVKLIDKNNLNNDYTKYSKVYAFATENISGYYSKIDFNDKKILTICSSGDHVLNAILLGAKKIDCFDTNVLTKYYMSLKMSAIKILNYNEFQQFFVSEKLFSYDLYKKIRLELSLENRFFWDYIYDKCNISDFILKFFIKTDYENTNKYYNLYFNEEKYNDLKKILLCNKINIKFYLVNVLDFDKKLKENYDYIFLSNIVDYLNYSWNKNDNKRYLEFLENIMNKKSNIKMICWSYIYNSKKKNKTMLKENVSYIDFENGYINGQIDSIGILEK